MKPITTIVCFLLITLISADSAEPLTPDQQMLVALKEVQAQQATMVANQLKIEEKLAALAEVVRVARIYSSRSGN